MEPTSQSHEAREGVQAGETPRQPQTAQPFRRACAGMRAVPGFDRETGRLAGVTLTCQPPRDGAGISVPMERPDLDAVLPPLRGWHWFGNQGDILCELMPTIREVLAQIADDIARDCLDEYQLGGIGAFADGLEEVATRRMSLPADEAEFQCARLLREYQDHLRRGANPLGFTEIEADDED